MSFLDFTAIRKEIPEKEKIWKILEGWVKKNPKRKAVPVIELVTDLGKEANVIELVQAIDLLVDRHLAKKSFRVVDPSAKLLLPQSYQDRESIPEKVTNNWEQWIEVTPKDVAMVLEPA